MKKLKHYTRSILMLIGFYFILGCTTPIPTEEKVIDTIIIKNSTDNFIQKVFVSEDFSKPFTKEGSISPLMANSQMYYGRPTKAKRLPNSLEVKWISHDNQTYVKKLNLQPFLHTSSRTQEVNLIIDFVENLQIKVYTQVK